MKELTQQRLKELLHYNPKSGLFTRVKPTPGWKVGSVTGYLEKKGDILINVDYKKYRAHRLACLYQNGEFPRKGMHCEHINRIRSDNRWKNLRIVTTQENGRNIRKDK